MLRASERLRGRLELAAPLAAAGTLVGLLANGWSGLWRESPAGRLALVALVGAIPAVVRALAGRRAAWWAAASSIPTAIVALGAAVGSSPIDVVKGDRETWGRLGDIIPDGLGNAPATPLPLTAFRTEALAGLLILVLAAAAALIAWQAIVSRRPLAAVIVLATGLAYRWTLVPPDHVIVAGVAALIASLVAFRLCGARRASRPSVPSRPLIAGSLVTVLALLGSAGVDRAPGSWWNWRDWNFGSSRNTTSLDLSQRYGPLNWPKNPVVLARVSADEPIPLRLQALEDFDGASWIYAEPRVDQRTTKGRIDFDADPSGEPRQVTQKITLENANTAWLPAGGRPTEVRGLGPREVTTMQDGAIRLKPPLVPGTTYEVDALLPDVTPSQLLQASSYGDVDPRYLRLGLVPDTPDAVTVPVWGSGAPKPAPQAFGAYSDVYRLSRQVIGSAKTPYEAVNRVESFLRRPANFVYDETTTKPANGQPDLAEFLLGRQRGYCQHFAGSMALMLRMNGIPARVVVGLTSDAGRYDVDKKSSEILDRDAHSWVEVQFPGNGWIPFDPTQGRSVPNRASVSSLTYSGLSEVQIDSEVGIEPAPVAPTPRPGAQRNEPAIPQDPGVRDRGISPWWLLGPLCLVALALLTPVALKAVRRVRRRRGDERARVLGAARELESLVRDAGSPVDPAMSPAERSAVLWRDLGIDAGRIYGLAREARFGATAPPAGSGKEAWDAFARARRALGWRRRLRAGLRLRSLRDG